MKHRLSNETKEGGWKLRLDCSDHNGRESSLGEGERERAQASEGVSESEQEARPSERARKGRARV